MGDRQWFILYILISLEVGIILVLAPWSVFWERNYFLQAYPGLGSFLTEPAVRGAVSGLGLTNIYVGLSAVLGTRTCRPREQPTPTPRFAPKPPFAQATSERQANVVLAREKRS
jgi:hypothetical protein